MDAEQFVQVFAAAMHNPDVFRQWIQSGQDIRLLNPSGIYLKHLSLRTIDSNQPEPSVEGHPDYAWIHQYHPEWIIHDANGNTVSLFASSEELVDFGNPAYLDWVFSQWFPHEYSDPSKGYFDSTDNDVNLFTGYAQDNGRFVGNNGTINCASPDAQCQTYNTDSGVQQAFKNLFDKFHQYYPAKIILVSTGPLSYLTPAQQLPVFEDVLSHADGYFSECLTNDPCYWNGGSNSNKRNALYATMQLADWLAANNKYFFPNIGMDNGQAATQQQINYGFAFFNLLRSGNRQFFSIVTKDSSTTCPGGCWQPHTYPEQTLALGDPVGPRTQIAPDVWTRTFTQAVAYVNLSDNTVAISLPAGANYKDYLGQAVSSPVTLASFSGLTVYGLQLKSVVSRMIHGTAGIFDINMPLTGTPGVECRLGANGTYTIVFTFGNQLVSVGGASVTTGTGTVLSSNIDITDPHNYIVNLTDVSDAQYVTVTLTNVRDAAQIHEDSVSSPKMGFLIGDVNGSGLVDSGDVFLVRQQTGQTAAAGNFREDVNAEGFIDSVDISLVQDRVRRVLP